MTWICWSRWTLWTSWKGPSERKSSMFLETGYSMQTTSCGWTREEFLWHYWITGTSTNSMPGLVGIRSKASWFLSRLRPQGRACGGFARFVPKVHIRFDMQVGYWVCSWVSFRWFPEVPLALGIRWCWGGHLLPPRSARIPMEAAKLANNWTRKEVKWSLENFWLDHRNIHRNKEARDE